MCAHKVKLTFTAIKKTKEIKSTTRTKTIKAVLKFKEYRERERKKKIKLKI